MQYCYWVSAVAVLLFSDSVNLISTRGLFRPGKSREGPGTGRDRTGPRDLEGPVVLAGQDLETLKVPWSWQDRT